MSNPRQHSKRHSQLCLCHLSNWPTSVGSSCRSRRYKFSQISLNAILTACKEDQFECAPGYCVSLSRRCDRYTDCIDGRDEQNCHNMSTNYHYLLQRAAKRHTRAKHVNQLLGLEYVVTHACTKWSFNKDKNLFDLLIYLKKKNMTFFFCYIWISNCMCVIGKHDDVISYHRQTWSLWDSIVTKYNLQV